MRYAAMITVVAALAMPGLALAQSNPITGRAAAQVHGQNWNMGQDLYSNPGPAAAANRTQALRAQSRAETGAQGRATVRRTSSAPQAAAPQSAAPQAAGRPAAGMASFEARMAEERRRQMEAERRAARAFPGVI